MSKSNSKSGREFNSFNKELFSPFLSIPTLRNKVQSNFEKFAAVDSYGWRATDWIPAAPPNNCAD